MPWEPYPSADDRSGDDRPDAAPITTGRDRASAGTRPAGPGARVVGLGALCDLSPTGNDDPHQFRFDVSEFAVLDEGEHVTLHRERGFTATTNGDDIWAHATVETITRDVLNVVLPDDSEITGDDHPWAWLAELLRAQGIEAVAGQLRGLPYEVVLTERVLQRLPRNS